MDLFDEKLKKMAAEDEIQVPEMLHERLVQITHPRKRFPVRRLVILAAVIALLGVLTVGASYRVGNDEMGIYVRPSTESEKTPMPTILPEADKEVIQERMDAETAEAFISAVEDGKIGIITEEEAQKQADLWEKYYELYQDEERQAAAMQAAEEAYYTHELWDAEVVGARFESRGINVYTSESASVGVILYLSDGCGYRMHMDADTLELMQATDLLPETMEDEYFDALWNGTVDEYNAEQAENAAG